MAKASLEIRRSEAGDLDFLESVEKSAFRKFEEYLGEGVEAYLLSPFKLMDSHEKGLLWVLTDGAIPVGFLCASLLDGSPHIEEFSIARDYQGKGHGKVMLTDFIKEMRGKSFGLISLTTNNNIPWNRPFYIRFGFEDIALEDCAPQLKEALIRDKEWSDMPETRIAMILKI